MAPKFLDGDYVYVDPDESAEPGRYVAVGDGGRGSLTIRLLAEESGRWVLRALNPCRSERALRDGDEERVRGVVVFAGRQV